MKLSIVGILYVAALHGYALTNVRANPLGSSFGSFPSYRSGGEQASGFADGFREWLRNVKNRFMGRGDGQTLPPPETANMLMELENETPQERQRNYPGGFFLDLTNLTFDPDRDWGFRLGQWYFIRRSNGGDSPADEKSSTYPDWPTMDDNNYDEINPPLVTEKSDVPTTIDATTPAGEEFPEVTESTSSTVEKDANDETNDNSKIIESAEVLVPSK